MGKLVQFERKSKDNRYKPFNMEEEIAKDTKSLADALKITEEEATKVAYNFCLKYPVLVEWVRSEEYSKLWK